jgi:hypothetical protein
MSSVLSLLDAHSAAACMYHATTVYNQGKTLADARGDVFRGLEVVEAAAGAGTHSKPHVRTSITAVFVKVHAVRLLRLMHTKCNSLCTNALVVKWLSLMTL